MTREMTRAELREQVAQAVALSAEHARRAEEAEAERDALKAAVEQMRAALEEIKLRTVQRDLNRLAAAALQPPAEKEGSSSSSGGGP